ncbi:hypothetical protein SCUCBS95973_009391 [Sporothrix curviconia]|uniref:Heat repeat protein n=1 Tax=Sporothrix curviconia TaxID=1260050 RepID=A0ABP0CWZ9_9PEZI
MDPHPQLAFRNSGTQRSEFFNKLKPCCLEIVKALRKTGGRNANPGEAAAAANDMVTLTDQLYATLTEQVGYDASVLDASMADYVFFPLLAVLQNMRSYPARLVENSAKCLRVLIQYGWQTKISTENAQRLLLLLTTVVTGRQLTPTAASPTRTPGAAAEAPVVLPEETLVEGYRALAALMTAAGAASTSPGSAESPLITANVIPVLAHSVSVMLEGVTDSIIPAIQIEALGAVEALFTSVKDVEALASFLPGTVSALVRVVAQPGAHKTPRRVVVRSLEVLFVVLVNTLGDLQTRRLQREAGNSSAESRDEEDGRQEEDVDEEVISDTISNSETLRPQSPSVSSTSTLPRKQKLDGAWLKATTAQVKIALTTILKLRNHESDEVRDAVQQFCVGLLDECHASLADSTSILVESAIVTLPATKDKDEAGSDAFTTLRTGATRLTTAFRSFGPQTTLQHLAILYPELSDVIKTTAYNWATGLPRAMQASDEGVKQRALSNVQKAIAVVEALDIDSTMLQASLTAALRDSVATLVVASVSSRAAVSEAVSEDAILQLATADGAKEVQSMTPASAMTAYKPILLSLSSQTTTRDAVLELVANIGPPAQQARLAGEMLDFVRDTDGADQVSAFWLSFELVKAAFSGAEEDPDSLLDLSSFNDSSSSSETEAVFEDLFSFAVSSLVSYSDVSAATTNDYRMAERDWRVGAIALEVTAFAAARLGEAFRPELIDVLYPIATFLGAPEDRLRAHAVATLNSLAMSCGYGNGGVSALIIDNVDYMLNSVSLRLNTFDISPASTRVLTMMIRLAGPRLVPYLDDVVAAIFAALDNYHGYPLFVENLFSVLGEVVRQSVKPSSSSLLLEDGTAKSAVAAGQGQQQLLSATQRNLKRRPDSTTTSDLVGILDRRTKRRKELENENEDGDVEEIGHPKEPWKALSPEVDKLLNKHEKKARKGQEGFEDDDDDDDNSDDDGEQPADTNKEGSELVKPEDPKTPTYALLARITTLTQHYLTAPTPALRKSLLDLLATVAPALAGADENAFLPLVNAIWPVVVTRLYDGEPYVVMAACDALAALCGSAGDFLSTRIKAEWQANLAAWCVRAKAAAANKVRGGMNTVSASASSAPPTAPAKSNVMFGNRPSVIHIHQRGTALKTRPDALKTRPDAPVVPSSSASSSSAVVSTGLGRFAQAVQVWEAVAGLLTAIVAYVKVQDEIYDSILDLLVLPAATTTSTSTSTSTTTSGSAVSSAPVRVLPLSEERKALDALAVVNPDAVWLARYRAGRLRDDDDGEQGKVNSEAWVFATPPVLAGVSFVSLV